MGHKLKAGWIVQFEAFQLSQIFHVHKGTKSHEAGPEVIETISLRHGNNEGNNEGGGGEGEGEGGETGRKEEEEEGTGVHVTSALWRRRQGKEGKEGEQGGRRGRSRGTGVHVTSALGRRERGST